MLLSMRHMLICAALSVALASAAYAGHAEARRGADHATPAAHKLSLRSAAAIIQDQETGEILYGKNASTVTPIASITKLMTAMVVLDAGLDLQETISISSEDMDSLRGTHSRLKPGASLSRDELLRVAHQYDLIRSYTTMTGHEIHVAGRPLAYRNTNRLVANGSWNIGLSKTGFTNDAGRCLVLQAKLAERKVIIVLLDSWGKLSRIGDANRIRAWLEANARPQSS